MRYFFIHCHFAEEKQSLIKKTVEKIGEASVAATHRAVISNDVSFQKIQNIRRGITLKHREPFRKPYTYDPDSYVFDREKVSTTITDCIATDLKINWSR